MAPAVLGLMHMLREREVVMHEPHFSFQCVVFFNTLQRAFCEPLARRALVIAEQINPDFCDHRTESAAGLGLGRGRSGTTERDGREQDEQQRASGRNLHDP